jgi:hypothetical protein
MRRLGLAASANPNPPASRYAARGVVESCNRLGVEQRRSCHDVELTFTDHLDRPSRQSPGYAHVAPFLPSSLWAPGYVDVVETVLHQTCIATSSR